jgi:hypothetical protein
MKGKSTPLLLLSVLFALLLAGCAAAQPAADYTGESAAPAEWAAPPGESDAYAGEPAAPGLQRKVIARASILLVVGDTEAAVDAINELVAEADGYVADANLYKSSYGENQVLRGTLTLRVASDRLDDVLSRLEALAVDVRSRSIDREDVTDQYTDIQAQLTNLEATETELRALLAEVREKPNSTAEDIIAVHRRMTEIRGEIEQLQGRRNMLDNLTSLATIEVELIPDALNRPVVQESWRPAVAVRAALRALVSTLQFLGEVAIWMVIYVLPLLLLVLIPTSILFWALRRWTRGRRDSVEVAGSGD